VGVGTHIGENGYRFTTVENADRIFYQREREMQGEEIQTTYRELIQLKLVGRFCDASGIDSDTVYSDLDKSVTLTDTILKDMGLN
jgi:hypothetical protein